MAYGAWRQPRLAPCGWRVGLEWRMVRGAQPRLAPCGWKVGLDGVWCVAPTAASALRLEGGA